MAGEGFVGTDYLGAGVILHRNSNSEVHGLTTAATIWITRVLRQRVWLCRVAVCDHSDRHPADAWRPVRTVVSPAFRLQ
jgi:hypothetical protein